jgi:hypothetical protein
MTSGIIPGPRGTFRFVGSPPPLSDRWWYERVARLARRRPQRGGPEGGGPSPRRAQKGLRLLIDS